MTIAETALGLVKKFLDGPAYQAAKIFVEVYRQGVDAAKVTARASLGAVNATLETTRRTQNILVDAAD